MKKTYSLKYYAENREKILAKSKEDYRADIEYSRLYRRTYMRAWRLRRKTKDVNDKATREYISNAAHEINKGGVLM